MHLWTWKRKYIQSKPFLPIATELFTDLSYICLPSDYCFNWQWLGKASVTTVMNKKHLSFFPSFFVWFWETKSSSGLVSTRPLTHKFRLQLQQFLFPGIAMSHASAQMVVVFWWENFILLVAAPRHLQATSV